MKKLNLAQKLKVSVIIPFFNRISFTIESVESVLAQTHKNWELLLIDDGSTDDLTALQALIEEDKRIRLLASPHLGAASARNLGIREASGDYIASACQKRSQ